MRTVQTWTIMENEMLVLDHIGLVWHVARKYRNTGYDLEDLAQEDTIGLIKAAGSFDPSRGTAYSTYAVKCIECEILMYLRKEKKHRTNSISLDQKMDVGGSEISFKDMVGREDPEIEMGLREGGIKATHQRTGSGRCKIDLDVLCPGDEAGADSETTGDRAGAGEQTAEKSHDQDQKMKFRPKSGQ